ncbi:VOC family protein [Shimia sp. MIT910701]|uniref:SMU1112c/YaeR family gloxylase I-like metalloprotein n=1 Tax=Shimia sp. MIT910701 TaxID=3096987 RepID=UPI00399B5240
MQLKFHHAALIVRDYEASKAFYCNVLGLQILAENYREDRGSWKLDMALADGGQLELVSFPNPPARPSRPEACGLRHIAFRVDDIDAAILELESEGVEVEPVRIDPYTHARFTFFKDPDGLRLELYEHP